MHGGNVGRKHFQKRIRRLKALEIHSLHAKHAGDSLVKLGLRHDPLFFKDLRKRQARLGHLCHHVIDDIIADQPVFD